MNPDPLNNPNNQTNQAAEPVASPTNQPEPVLQQPLSGRSHMGLIVGGIVVAVLLVAIAGAWLWLSNAGQDYAKAVPAYRQSVQQAYDSLNEQPPDTDAYRAYLQKNIALFKDTTAAAPAKPTLIGITTVADNLTQEVGALTSKAKEVQVAMEQYLAFMIYRDSLLEIIKDNSIRVSSVDDLRAAKTKLEANNAKLEALQPPSGLEGYAQQKVKIYQDILADINGAVEAYDSGNASAYEQHVTKLADDAKRTSLGATTQEMLDNHTYYDNFIKAATGLETLLKQ